MQVPGPRSQVPGPRSQVPGPRSQVSGPRPVKTPDVQRVATTAATIPCNTPLPHSMLTKVKHFGVRNNIEKGRGSSLAQTVSRFVAGIV